MPRDLISPHELSRILANGPVVFSDGDVSEGHSFDNVTQDSILLVHNTDAASQTIQVPKRLSADGNSFVTQDLTLVAGGVYAFDWFENQWYGWIDSDNDVETPVAVVINVSSANIKLAILPRGNRNTVVV